MSKVTFNGLADFARRAPDIFERDLDGLTVALLQGATAMAVDQAVTRTPRAARKSAWARAQGAPTSEHMQDRWWLAIGGAATLIKRRAGRAVAAAIKRLVPIVVGNDALYAHIIDRGLSVVTRRLKSGGQSKPYRTGSPRAPRGILIPTREAMDANFDAIATRVIAEAERRAAA